MGKSIRVGIYARVSTMDQHCSQQLQELRAYAEARGWRIEGEFIDQGISGAKGSRPAMDRLMPRGAPPLGGRHHLLEDGPLGPVDAAFHQQRPGTT